MPSSNQTCAVCQLKFSSRSHLRRHEASHEQQSSVSCEFCGRKYSRNDSLRRHYQRCPKIGSDSRPPPSKTGRRRKACDACAKSRITCDGNHPCTSCELNEMTCTYRRLDQYTPEVDTIPGSSNSVSQDQDATGTSNQQAQHEKGKLPFLLNYSAPSNRTPAESNRALALLSSREREQEADSTLPSFNVEADQADLFNDYSWSLFFGPFETHGLAPNTSLAYGLEDLGKREAAADRMIHCLHETAAMHNSHWREYDISRAREIFHERNIGDFIEAYFEQTVRPRSRVVLKTSFNLETASSPLLLAMFLMGAVSSSANTAKSEILPFIDMIEYAIFESPGFLELSRRKRSYNFQGLENHEIETLQAAIMIILVQIVSSNPEARRRVQFQRYPALVSVARITSLTNVRNYWHDSSVPLNHEMFLNNETCIRLMASISMIDTHNIIFFNNPPYFTMTEFEFDLPAEEKGVDISDPSDWELWAKNERSFLRPPPTGQFLKELLAESWKGAQDPRFQNLNVFALFIIISEFHGIIFGIRSSICDMSHAKAQVERALSRWMALWEQLQPTLTQDQIYRAGIMIHAPDLWAFAKFILNKPLSETGQIASDSMAHIHQLLKTPLR